MSIFKKVVKLVGSIIPGGGVVAALLSPGKTPEQVAKGLEALDPIAQYNKTLARPRIALVIVYVYVTGVGIQWIQQVLSVDLQQTIVIPVTLIGFAKVVVIAYFGSRGIENIFGLFKKDKKK